MESAIKIFFLAIAYLALFIIGATSGLIHRSQPRFKPRRRCDESSQKGMQK